MAASGRPLTYLPLTLHADPAYLSRDCTKRCAFARTRAARACMETCEFCNELHTSLLQIMSRSLHYISQHL